MLSKLKVISIGPVDKSKCFTQKDLSDMLDFQTYKLEIYTGLIKNLDEMQGTYILQQPKMQILILLLFILHKSELNGFLSLFDKNVLHFEQHKVNLQNLNPIISQKINQLKSNADKISERVSKIINKRHKDLTQGKLHRKMQQLGSKHPHLIQMIKTYKPQHNSINYHEQLREFLIKQCLPVQLNFVNQEEKLQCYKLILSIDFICLIETHYPTKQPYKLKELKSSYQDIKKLTLHQTLEKIQKLNQKNIEIIKIQPIKLIIKIKPKIKQINKVQQLKQYKPAHLHHNGQKKNPQDLQQIETQRQLFNNKKMRKLYPNINTSQSSLKSIGPVMYNKNIQLGDGRDCRVYQGKYYQSYQQSPIDVAVKIFKNNYSYLQQNYPKFNRQIIIMEKINHPNIIKFYFKHIQNDNLCLILERCSHDLSKQIKIVKKLSQNDVYKYVFQIIGAINYLHNFDKEKILHRDLKPQNILLKNGNIIIADFGRSRAIISEQINANKTIVGSKSYMAPEVIKNLDHVDYTPYSHKCDIWSIGCIIYEMLTGNVLFKNNCQQEKDTYKNKIKRQLITKNKFWSKLLDSMLNYQQKNRPESKCLMVMLRQQLERKQFIKEQQVIQKLRQMAIYNEKHSNIQPEEEIQKAKPLMIEFMYYKIKLTQSCLSQLQYNQASKYYLSEYLNWLLRFILLKWYVLELKEFYQFLNKDQSVSEIKRQISNIVKQQIPKRQNFIKDYYQFLNHPKFESQKRKLNSKLSQFLKNHNLKKCPKELNEILSEFLSEYGTPKNEKIDYRDEIWRIAGQIYLLNVKEQKYPIEYPYEKKYQLQFEQIKKMKSREIKGIIYEIKPISKSSNQNWRL